MFGNLALSVASKSLSSWNSISKRKIYLLCPQQTKDLDGPTQKNAIFWPRARQWSFFYKGLFYTIPTVIEIQKWILMRLLNEGPEEKAELSTSWLLTKLHHFLMDTYTYKNIIWNDSIKYDQVYVKIQQSSI